MPIPKAIQNAPELFLGLEFAYYAFWELNTSRPVGWTAGPLPWWVIHQYAQSQGLDQDEEVDFAAHIRAMDRAFLAYNEEQSRKSSTKSKIGSK